MGLFKKRLTEAEACLGTIRAMMHDVERQWPRVRSALQDALGADKFVFADEERAKVDLMLAALALEMLMIQSVFGREQAIRLTGMLIGMVRETQTAAAVDELREYLKLVDEAREHSVTPALQVALRLLPAWIGPQMSEFCEGQSNGLHRTALMLTGATAVGFTGYMKRASEHYRIVPA